MLNMRNGSIYGQGWGSSAPRKPARCSTSEYKNDEFCIQNEELCIKNGELCVKNDGFCRIDTGRDGTITTDEMAATMQSLPEKSEVMARIDSDRSGEIEFPEFEAVVGQWIRGKLAMGLEEALAPDKPLGGRILF